MCSISNGKILRHSLTDVVNIDCAHSIYRIIVFFYLFIACNIPYKCQWKRWRNCCLGNNNNHFGIIVTHVGNCESVCVCNEVVLVNTKCAPEKRSVAIVNVVRLTTIWRLIKGIRLHIWRELANTRNWLLCTFWRQFWWEKSSACAIKDITKWILLVFFLLLLSNLQYQKIWSKSSEPIERNFRMWMNAAIHYTELFYFGGFFSCHSVSWTRTSYLAMRNERMLRNMNCTNQLRKSFINKINIEEYDEQKMAVMK